MQKLHSYHKQIHIKQINKAQTTLYIYDIPHRLVIALEIANAVQTPFPEPDISSPSNNFENLSFIISISTQSPKNQKQFIKQFGVSKCKPAESEIFSKKIIR